MKTFAHVGGISVSGDGFEELIRGIRLEAYSAVKAEALHTHTEQSKRG
jgi:hypothetical protein